MGVVIFGSFSPLELKAWRARELWFYGTHSKANCFEVLCYAAFTSWGGSQGGFLIRQPRLTPTQSRKAPLESWAPGLRWVWH